VFLAPLHNVDQEQVEAATIDGAGKLRRLIDVTLPAIFAVAMVNLLLTTILTLNYFDIIDVLTRGGRSMRPPYSPLASTRSASVNSASARPRLMGPLGAGAGPVRRASPSPPAALHSGGMIMRRRSTLARRAPFIACQVAIALLVLFPFFWMFSVSLKAAAEPCAIPARLSPEHVTLDNYVSAFRPEFRRYFLNSLIVSGATVLIAVPLALLPAYSLTRYQFRALSVFLGAVILAQFFLAGGMIIPIYKMAKAADLLNTYAALIIAYITVTLPVAIWMLRGFLMRVPRTLEEAAAVDGAKPLRVFFDIVVPLARPGIIATTVFVLIVTWQEFLFALSFTSTKEMRTLPVGMNDHIGQYGIRYGELMASSVMVSLPLIDVFFFLQRQFVAGLTAGAVKG
jgi:multiple sugar transport system permease protein